MKSIRAPASQPGSRLRSNRAFSNPQVSRPDGPRSCLYRLTARLVRCLLTPRGGTPTSNRQKDSKSSRGNPNQGPTSWRWGLRQEPRWKNLSCYRDSTLPRPKGHLHDDCRRQLVLFRIAQRLQPGTRSFRHRSGSQEIGASSLADFTPIYNPGPTLRRDTEQTGRQSL